MISKHVLCHPEHDNYARLAAYIADAGHDGEKCLLHWCAGCWNEQDYALAVLEAETVQALNTRTTKEKTYHLLISFRPEDEAKLTPETFKAIEQRFASALGFSEHQRHCGVHKNTNNIHLHIAYNRIHPERLTRHDPFRDFKTLSATCRELEQEYGFVVDNGFAQANENSLSHKAATLEAQSGEESFEGYAKRHAEEVLSVLEQAQNWQDLHEGLACYGLGIKPYGNGLVVVDIHGKHAAKASAVHCSLSAKALQERFGGFQPCQTMQPVQELSRYQAVPLHRSPERGELFARYQAGIEQRKTRLEAVKEQENAALAAIRQQWEGKRRELEHLNIAKRNRRNLLALARKHEAEALAKARLEWQPQRDVVRQEVPYTSWQGFLKMEAENGNELALAVLRSRKDVAEPEQAHNPAQTPSPKKDWSSHGLDYITRKAELAEQQRNIVERTNLSATRKRQLQAFARMDEVAAEAKAQGNPLGKVQKRVDGKGVVIFTLESGGSIRDTGKEIFFSGHDKAAEQVAKNYAVKKWGKAVQMEGNMLRKDLGNTPRKMDGNSVDRLQTWCP